MEKEKIIERLIGRPKPTNLKKWLKLYTVLTALENSHTLLEASKKCKMSYIGFLNVIEPLVKNGIVVKVPNPGSGKYKRTFYLNYEGD